MGRLEPVAFDIETSGLLATDVVTAVGVRLPLGVRVFVHVRDRHDALEDDRLQDRLNALEGGPRSRSGHPNTRTKASCSGVRRRSPATPGR